MLLVSGILLTLGYVIPPYLSTWFHWQDRIYHALRMLCYIGSYTFFVTTYTRNAPKSVWRGWKFVVTGSVVCFAYCVWALSSFFCMAGLCQDTWTLHQANTIAFLVGVETLLFIWGKSVEWKKLKTNLIILVGRFLVLSELVIYIVFLVYYYPNHHILHYPYGELVRAFSYLASFVVFLCWTHKCRPLDAWQPNKPAIFYYAPLKSKEVVGSLFGGAVYAIENGKGVLYSYITCENKVVRFENGEAMVREFIGRGLMYATRVCNDINDMRPTEGWEYIPYSWKFWKQHKTCVQLRQYALKELP